MATSRAAWPHALHFKLQQQQQREKSWREQIGCFVSWCFLYVRATSRGGGDRSGLHGEIFVGMMIFFLRWIHLSMEIKYF